MVIGLSWHPRGKVEYAPYTTYTIDAKEDFISIDSAKGNKLGNPRVGFVVSHLLTSREVLRVYKSHIAVVALDILAVEYGKEGNEFVRQIVITCLAIARFDSLGTSASLFFREGIE